MKKKNYLTLDDEFLQYCKLNNIEDIEKTAKDVFSRGFTILKYGEIPIGNKTKEKIIEKEIIKEIIVEKEVPVERIVEKEIIKEIPVEKIVEVIKEVPIEIKGETQIITKEVIKKVPVEKIVEVENKEEILRLTDENTKLKNELDKITKSLGNLNKAKYMKNSNLGSLYDE
jgi:hypothetical protein